MPRFRTLALAPVLSALLFSAAAGEPRHPLDPLSAAEIEAAIAAVAACGRSDRTTRAATVTLAEPDKAAVLAWQPGAPLDRRASAVLRVGGETVEAVIDLAAGELESWRTVPGAQPPIRSDEWAAAEEAVKAEPRWQAAMRARGYERFADIFCESLSAGQFGRAEEAGRRLLKMPCYDVAGADSNVYARPIEGVIATVDLDTLEVVDLLDTGVVPVGAEPHGFRGTAAPAAAGRLADPAVTLDGRMVGWGSWSFHLGFDARFGPVLSLVAFDDGGRRRSVLYQAHVSEVFVPYMDPDPAWAFRTYLDAGEYGLGTLSSELRPGIDCPADAHFLDAALPTPSGGVRTVPSRLCVFERETGAPLWRHAESLTGTYAGTEARELVVRSIPSVAHYDYAIDWVFTPSGEIRVMIGATGIDAVKGVALASMAEPGADAATRHGTLVAPGLVAVHHDHFFSVRLDLDVDGPVNSFVRETIRREALDAQSPRRSLWRLERAAAGAEGPVRAADAPELWSVENPERATTLGHRPAYQIQAEGPTSLLAPDDWPQRRAAFSAANLWITRRRPGELYAAGAYPNQSQGGGGLPAYADGEDIEAADLVAWATIGFRHVTRPEDWPVLSTV